MSFIYVTGIAGAGKSTVCEELKQRGYEAYEADNSLSNFYNNETGEMIENHLPLAKRTPEWRKHHTWKMSKDKLLQLKDNAQNKHIFVCGVAANEEDYIDVFDKIYALVLNLPAVKHRILTRATSDFGKSAHEMNMIEEWYYSTDEYYQKIGAHLIDASQPPEKVVDDILEFD